MNPQLLPAQLRDDVPAWAQTVVAFLAEKKRRSGSRRTVESYARMLWPFFERVGSPAHLPASLGSRRTRRLAQPRSTNGVAMPGGRGAGRRLPG